MKPPPGNGNPEVKAIPESTAKLIKKYEIERFRRVQYGVRM